MMTVTTYLERDYHHPYQPYDIQKEFMGALYDCIEEGKLGIFESPTGTGKSLSLICGSLTWLREHKRKIYDSNLAAVEADDGEPEWMREHAREQKKREALQKRAELEAKLDAIRQKERRVKQKYENGEPFAKRRKVAEDGRASDADEEDQFALDDYESEDETAASRTEQSGGDYGLSSETQALMEKLGYSIKAPEADAEADDELKIIFSSRTHSQLSQFVGELRRVKLPPALPLHLGSDPPTKPEKELHEELKHLTLGSRKNLCINPKVASLKSPTAVNERCLELQQSKTPADKKCPYLPNKDNEALVVDFQNHALAKIRDIEDMGELGKKISICPYYASRSTIRPSEIVTLPYPLLLQKTAREALGLALKDHVVIIDEAHNLMDAITGIYTVEVSLSQLQRAKAQLMIYLQKFRNRLKGKNRVYVTQVVRLLDSLAGYLQSKASSNDDTVRVSDLLAGKGLDQINLYKLMHYLQESKLARKVEGYASHSQQQKTQQASRAAIKPPDSSHEATVPVLTHIQNFFLALTNPDAEGRFFYTPASSFTQSSPALKYMLLDPSQHFRDTVENARAVILAGGTMSPMDDYIHQLFPYLSPERIRTLSCGHVIPPENLFVSAVEKAADGSAFDFTFASRDAPATIAKLGDALLRLLPCVPDGAVVFFPSYAYLERVVSFWKSPGSTSTSTSANSNKSLYARLSALKPIFTESQTTPVDATLSAYSDAILSHRSRGALLLAVIGGRLSEGINFSDRLGRCVIVVGLPYPNPHSPEWKAKMEYIEAKAASLSQSQPLSSNQNHSAKKVKGEASREFAENVCMRAVNQAIGRAVRHRGDWAGILLVDRRYGSERIRGKLPGWIRASLRGGGGGGFGDVEGGLRRFYDMKRGGDE